MTALVSIEGISQSFGQARVLDAVSLAIQPGSYTVLLGPSGSGKTTLLSILGGFLQPTTGRVLIEGEDCTAMAPAQRPTATVFQDYALFPHLTVEQNIAFPLSRWWWPRPSADVAKRVRDLMDIFEIGSLAQSYPWQISGGQRQRVGLARTLIRKPAVLLLDEPFAALDPLLRIRMRQELLNTQWLFKVPMLVITHDPQDVAALAENLVVLHKGKVERTVDLKGPPYRNEKGVPVRGVIRQLLMETPVQTNGTQAPAAGQVAG